METEQTENTLATRTEVDDLLDLRASYLHTIELQEKEIERLRDAERCDGN